MYTLVAVSPIFFQDLTSGSASQPPAVYLIVNSSNVAVAKCIDYSVAQTVLAAMNT